MLYSRDKNINFSLRLKRGFILTGQNIFKNTLFTVGFQMYDTCIVFLP